MHEQWISAWDAFRIPSLPSTICTRLHAGLIRARAKRLFVGPKRYDDQEIMPEFWWAEGQDALDQNWQAGDFSTWIEQEVHIRAFGVTFELAGILDALPAEERASVSIRLSVAGNENWLRAAKAVDFIQRSSDLERGSAVSALIEQAGFGFVASRAILAKQSTGPEDTGQWEWQRREWDVASDLFLELQNVPGANIDFESGTISADNCQALGGKHISLSGIHFLLEPIEIAWAKRPIANATPKSGGRPPAAFLEDLMCAIWEQIYSGDLRPKTQAEIERAILAWITDNGHELSESSARTKARKIWNAMSAEGNKPRK